MDRRPILPDRGAVFFDVRDGGRALRVSTHRDGDMVVLSMWRGDTCTASFRLDQADVPTLIDTLVRGLAPVALTGDRAS